MKKFFLNALSSFVGAWVAIVLAGIVTVLLVFALAQGAFGGPGVSLGKNTVLEVKLSGALLERNNQVGLGALDLFNGDLFASQSVETLVTAIREAKTNDLIDAIYLDCGIVSAAPASLYAIREALLDFKSSKKKIYAYGDVYSQGAYFVASVADEMSLNPSGSVSFQGLGGQTLFYKGLFDKIGLEFQVVRVGKGKAAVEPYTVDTMSMVARTQSRQMMDTLWKQMRSCIAEVRPAITPAAVDSLINVEYISEKPAEFVLESKLVDRLEYRNSFEERIAKAAGQDKKLEKRISPQQFVAIASPGNDTSVKNQVAVLYACGAIDDVMGEAGINSSQLVDNILSLAENDEVKALVLRVNSPGGSAFGSEQIWEALQTFKKTGRPLIVSMGDYAASGGYYISCGADRIFANPFTITGSIGIFGLIPNVEGLMHKLGVNVEMVATNPAGQFPTGLTPLTGDQMAAMQSMVENGYQLFVKRCAEGRKVSTAKIEEIADGRPLPAVMAKNYGLVDELGTLQDAVAYAAKQAKLKDYNTVAYPAIEMSIFRLISDMQMNASRSVSIAKLLMSGDVSKYASAAQTIIDNLRTSYPLRAETIHFKFSL